MISFSQFWNYISDRIFNIVGNRKQKKQMKHLILFGPPGSGKGTQAKKLVEKFEMIHISTGDLFRYEIGNNTPLGQEAQSYMDKGQLVPDSVTIGMLKNKVNKHPEAKGFIFDGFPRTIAQSEALDAFLNEREEAVNGLIALDVADEEIVKRLLERGLTSGRKDDANEEVIGNRIAVYKKETSPVYNYYNEQNKSKTLEGQGTIEEIFDRLSAAVDSL